MSDRDLTPGAHLIVIEDEYDDTAARLDADGNAALLEEYRREDMRVRLVCTGVTDSCRFWLECLDPAHTHPDIHDIWDRGDDEEPVIGGKEHRWLDGSWMTRVNQCIVTSDGYECDFPSEAPREVGFIPGVYPVEFEWDEGTCVWLAESKKVTGAADDAEIEHALATVPVDPCKRCGNHPVADNHAPCCSSHNVAMCHHCYSRTHFVETGCCGPQYALVPRVGACDR